MSSPPRKPPVKKNKIREVLLTPDGLKLCNRLVAEKVGCSAGYVAEVRLSMIKAKEIPWVPDDELIGYGPKHVKIGAVREKIEAALKLEEYYTLSDSKISEKLGVSNTYVGRFRQEMTERGEIPHIPVELREGSNLTRPHGSVTGAIMRLLLKREWQHSSDRVIAKEVGCSSSSVNRARRILVKRNRIPDVPASKRTNNRMNSNVPYGSKTYEVERRFLHHEGTAWESDSRIAIWCDTTIGMVGKVRRRLEASGQIETVPVSARRIYRRSKTKLNEVEDSIIENPHRSDALVAQEFGITTTSARRLRHRMEKRGLIERVEWIIDVRGFRRERKGGAPCAA